MGRRQQRRRHAIALAQQLDSWVTALLGLGRAAACRPMRVDGSCIPFWRWMHSRRGTRPPHRLGMHGARRGRLLKAFCLLLLLLLRLLLAWRFLLLGRHLLLVCSGDRGRSMQLRRLLGLPQALVLLARLLRRRLLHGGAAAAAVH